MPFEDRTYTTLEEAEDYFGLIPEGAYWSSLDEEVQEQCLSKAYDYLHRFAYTTTPVGSTWIKEAQCLEAISISRLGSSEEHTMRRLLQSQGVAEFSFNQQKEVYVKNFQQYRLHSAEAYAVIKPYLVKSPTWVYF
jgi:hypothetical protein